jgi:hypothetical protein
LIAVGSEGTGLSAVSASVGGLTIAVPAVVFGSSHRLREQFSAAPEKAKISFGAA